MILTPTILELELMFSRKAGGVNVCLQGLPIFSLSSKSNNSKHCFKLEPICILEIGSKMQFKI